MTYQWKEGSHVKADAQAVGKRLEQLHKRDGATLTPAVVVRDARKPDSPLHPCFEWDDSKAAMRYREDQARYVLRSIVVVDEGQQDKRPLRAYVVVTEGEDEHYTSVLRAMDDPALRQQVLERAWNELEAWRKRYAEYKELAGIFSAMDAVKPAAA